jgi:outer membrane protein OmpA-like peptidoglycan-associated protein
VADALLNLGVDPARLRLEAHAEASPRTSNATEAGHQQNRRVEVTLIGQQTPAFNRTN